MGFVGTRAGLSRPRVTCPHRDNPLTLAATIQRSLLPRRMRCKGSSSSFSALTRRRADSNSPFRLILNETMGLRIFVPPPLSGTFAMLRTTDDLIESHRCVRSDVN